MGRRRKTGKTLPHRVYKKHGAYFFVAKAPITDPSDGKLKKWIRLCDSDSPLSLVYSAMASILPSAEKTEITEEGSMADICRKFKSGKLNYSTETNEQYSKYLDIVADEFSEFMVSDVTASDWNKFLAGNFSERKNTAQKITALAKRVFQYAKQNYGYIAVNPLDKFDLGEFKTGRREFIPSTEQMAKIRHACLFDKGGKPIPSGIMISCIIDMSFVMFGRAIDVRELKKSQVTNGRIFVQPSKTLRSSGKATSFLITPGMQEILDKADRYCKDNAIVSDYIFPSTKGAPYTQSGIRSAWKRAIERAGMPKDVQMPQFRDLRALGATTAAKHGENKDAIRARLSHTSTKTTDIYIKEVIPEPSDMDVPVPWKKEGGK
jgi:integrase